SVGSREAVGTTKSDGTAKSDGTTNSDGTAKSEGTTESPGTTGSAAFEVAAATLLQPRVRTGDPAFAPLYAAVRARRAVVFEYRKDPATPAEPRRVQPWGLVSFRGRWYVIGHDEKRAQPRTFRLSRIAGPVKAVGRSGVVRTPPDIDLLQEVADSVERPADRTATVRIRSGRAAGLRRTAISAHDSGDPDWDRVTLPLGHLWDTARRIAGQGPDVVVEEPADLVAATVRLLEGSRRAMRTTGRGVAGPAEPDDGGTLAMSDTA
ncbi:MAG: WYL domain-containing protein, partial [Nakamurella sp.]